MKQIALAFMALSLPSFAAAPTLADCLDRDTTASTADHMRTGIAKDGTHAPLETNNGTNTTGAQPAQKDGNSMPLANQEGGGNQDLATSQQDVNAQQHGQKTAAAQANDNRCADKK